LFILNGKYFFNSHPWLHHIFVSVKYNWTKNMRPPISLTFFAFVIYEYIRPKCLCLRMYFKQPRH